MGNDTELIKELGNQQVLENLEAADETNEIVKRTLSLKHAICIAGLSVIATVVLMGLWQWNIGYTLSKAIGAVPKNTLSGAEMYELLQQKDRQVIWFDRKRIHSDAGFAKVDEQFPAQYEVWAGEKLIERWHWKVTGDERTNQFGDYILRCVANYDHAGKYTGFTQYQMSDYPKGEASIESERMIVDNSISMEVDINDGGVVTIQSADCRCVWEGGIFQYGEQLTNNFPHHRGSVGPLDLINCAADENYIEHISSMFAFLKTDILDSRKNFLTSNAIHKF